MTGGSSLAQALAAGVIVVAFALACGDAFAASISFSTRPVALHSTDRAVQYVGRLHFLGGLDLRSDEPAFGGLSGLDVTDDGRLTSVTDRGHWFTARIVRDDFRPPRGPGRRRSGAAARHEGPAGRGVSGAMPKRWSACPAATGW